MRIKLKTTTAGPSGLSGQANQILEVEPRHESEARALVESGHAEYVDEAKIPKEPKPEHLPGPSKTWAGMRLD